MWRYRPIPCVENNPILTLCMCMTEVVACGGNVYDNYDVAQCLR